MINYNLLLLFMLVSVDKTVCEAKLGFVNCPLGQFIQIDSVLYGRTQQSICNQFNLPISNLNCKSTAVSTNSVISDCQGRSACLLSADNRRLGEDPCPQTSKYLQVNYSKDISLPSICYQLTIDGWARTFAHRQASIYR